MNRSSSSRTAPTLLAGWLLAAAVPALSEARAITEIAAQRLVELHAQEGGQQTPRELFLRNLSRYFARYLVPANRDELLRVVSTTERITARAALGLFDTLQAGAAAGQLTVIPPEFVDGLMARVVPALANGYDEMVFFPQQPPGRRLTVETADLAAFAETGFAWQVIAALDPEALESTGSSRPLTEAAADAFHRGLNAYGLLLVRVAGLHAARDLAPHLQTRHLRAAAKTLASSEGDFVPLPPPAATDGPFTDVTAASGFAFRHLSSRWLAEFRRHANTAPSFGGGGVSAGDLDGDGWDDLVVCGGRGCAAFRNRGDGSFQEITAESGIAVPGEARMAVIADFDNDGDRDLFITYVRDSNRLFANDGHAVFRDVTADSGLERIGDISGPATAVDVDGDALLDIVVGNFGDYLAGEAPWREPATNGMPNRLYLNRGGLRFEDVSARSGIADTGWSQALSHCDLDRDGDQDLYVANDFGHNELFLNDGRGLFTASAETTASADEHHGMNVSFADLNGDRFGDLFITNIWSWDPVSERVEETNSLFLSQHDPGPDQEHSQEHGRGTVSYERFSDPTFLGYDTGWSWAAPFFDFDLDGDDDLFIANGFTDYFTFMQLRPHPEIPEQLYPENNSREANWLFRQDGEQDGDLQFVPVASSLALEGYNSRGAALLDFDRDGDLDLAISTFHAPARLFRNDTPRAGNRWLAVELEGDPERGVNRDAIGAQVIATDGAVTGGTNLSVWRSITGGDAYLSERSATLHFGLAAVDVVDLEILWPGGELQTVTGVAANQHIRVRQGGTGYEVVGLE